MGILASRGIEYEDSYRAFSEKERQQLLSLFDRLATANEHGIMKVELEPFKVRISHELHVKFEQLLKLRRLSCNLSNPSAS